MIKRIIFFFLSVYAANSHSQSLNTYPQLNAGGYINDIWEDTTNNKIYIAGNFTSVNGSARKNIARLTYNPIFNSFSLDAWAPITTMTGEIKCMAKYNNNLHIGGNYTSANGNATLMYWSVINVATGVFDTSFDPDAGGILNDINDFALDGNILYVTGMSLIYDDGGDFRLNFGAFDLSTTFPNYPAPVAANPNTLNPSFNWGSMETVRLHLSGNRIYLCGKSFGGPLNDGIVAFDKTTLLAINTFNPSFTFEQVIDCETYNGKVFIVNSKIWPGGESVLELDAATGILTPGAIDPSASGTPYSIEIYKDYLFIAGSYTFLQGSPQNYLGSVDLSTTVPYTKTSWNPVPNAALDNRYALHRWKNRLYVSDNNLANISATPRTGMVSYCMEPLDPVQLSVASPNACPADVFNYSIQLVPYAFGYTWWYTGNDATITGNGTQNISISFGENATSGTLYVSPYSRCNLYSDTLTYPITVNPRPDADAGLDSALNCVRLSLGLSGNSTSSPVNFQWNGPSGYNSSSQNPTITIDGEYILTVTNTSTGCWQKDTVMIVQDTITPDVILPTGPFTLTCSDTLVLLDGNSATVPTDLYWRKFNGGAYPDSFYADSIGQYFLVVTNTRNGCKDSSFLIVNENRVAPDLDLSSHNSAFLTIDTLTCTRDSIWVIGTSSTNNTLFHWEDTLQVISNDDSVLIVNSAAYSFWVKDTINGCSSTLNFFISEYKTVPDVILPTGVTDMTCSNDTVVLDGNTFSSNTNLLWAGPNGFTSADPAIVNETGYFILTAIKNDNGCSFSDSILVSQIPLIEISLNEDTLVCAGSPVDLSVTVTGNFPSLNYSWSNGGNNAALISVSPNTTTEYFVTVSDGTGCAGFDSITVNIPIPITDSVLSFASCDTTIGEIQVYAQGGIPPYSYSADGINFQSSNSFTVPYGNYTITIMDSLGCLHFTNATVNDNSQLPEPDFLVSTSSFLEDTLVLINISNPQPDSLAWIFPFGTTLILNNMETPWIILPDTGTYQIELRGIYGNCQATKVKTIHVRAEDTTVADFYNLNGIDTILVTPNPNPGIFDLEIVFHRKQDFSVLIYDLSGNLQWSDFKTEIDYYLENIQLGNLQNGTYLIRVVAEFDARSIYFVIQH